LQGDTAEVLQTQFLTDNLQFVRSQYAGTIKKLLERIKGFDREFFPQERKSERLAEKTESGHPFFYQ
jgi:hypothetical protein